MPHAYRAHLQMDENGELRLKDLPFEPGEAVEVIILSDEKPARVANPAGASGDDAAGGVDALAILESMAGTVDAPADWAAEHDHYLYGTPKRSDHGE